MQRLKNWARRLKRDIIALWLAGRDPRVPRLAKIIAATVAAYALSPIDLIPDFVPVLGIVDDLVLLPLGIMLAVRFIPEPIMAELRAQAVAQGKPTSWAAALVILLGWLGALGLLSWLLWPEALQRMT